MLLTGFFKHFKLSRIQSFDKGTKLIRMWCENNKIVGASPNRQTNYVLTIKIEVARKQFQRIQVNASFCWLMCVKRS